jgi:transaldolase
MTKLNELSTLGQSVWLDYIQRSFTRTGKLKALIDQGIRGVTSNPTIFDKAIVETDDYSELIKQLAEAGKNVENIYETLVFEDIREAADLFVDLYNKTAGKDGYVSLEVNPNLAHDTAKTISEAKRLFSSLDRPNIMIKIPATPAGMPAIKSVIAAGINVNVTLIFSLEQYEAAAEAYISGLEQLIDAGGNPAKVASVASFFVSRVDSAVDLELKKIGMRPLVGKLAVDNARLAYSCFKEIFCGQRWEQLKQAGAQVQRPLWASTGTKNPDYSDTMYIDDLIGNKTVNTIPPATLAAFMDHGTVSVTIDRKLADAHIRMSELKRMDIDMTAMTEKLLADGVTAFANSFKHLMDSIDKRKTEFLNLS